VRQMGDDGLASLVVTLEGPSEERAAGVLSQAADSVLTGPDGRASKPQLAWATIERRESGVDCDFAEPSSNHQEAVDGPCRPTQESH
jgi:hypothetical protein